MHMEINSQLVIRFFTIPVLSLALLIIFPLTVLALTNYGDESYGGGNYNIGDMPAPGTTLASVLTCDDFVTKGMPDLFEIRTTKNNATLYFAPPAMPYSNFYIAYSQKPNVWQYGVQFDQGNSSGVVKYTINKLASNTKYYFRMRAGNGCMAGNWGNIMTAVTTSSSSQRTYYKNFSTSVNNKIGSLINTFLPYKTKTQTQNLITPVPTPTIQTQVQASSPTPLPSKTKFCILWWCF